MKGAVYPRVMSASTMARLWSNTGDAIPAMPGMKSLMRAYPRFKVSATQADSSSRLRGLSPARLARLNHVINDHN